MKTITPDRDASAARLIGRLGLRAAVATPERRATLLRRVERLNAFRSRFWQAATKGQN